MRSISLSIVIAVMICTVACSPSNDGKFELPVRNPSLTEVMLPTGPLISGEAYSFTANWLNGRPVFEVTWIFDGGIDPLVTARYTEENTHTLSIIAKAAETEPIEYAGQVFVMDFHENTTILSFSFTVVPAE